MRRFLTKHKTWLPVVILSILYLVTRLYNLLVLPLFTDESIYIYWAKVIADTHAQWFISLTDGKPPLLIWMISILLSLFPPEWYLLAGRLPSVAMGLLGMLGVYFLAMRLFTSQRIGILAGILYIICPMTLFYDRMALFDAMLTAMLVWSVYFAYVTGETKKWIYAVLWGIFLGLAFLSKPTALLFLPFTVIVCFSALPLKKLRHDWKRLSLYSLLAIIISEGINNLQRISSAYPAMVRKNAQFQQPIAELLKNPFVLTLGNMKGFMGWTIDYLTIGFFSFGLIAFAFGLYQRSKAAMLLLFLWLFPLIALATVGREVFPRYILIVFPYFLIIAAYFIDYLLRLKNIGRYIGIVVVTLVLLPLLSFDFFILTDPVKAPSPIADKNQYVLQHPSGYGLAEVYAFLKEKSENQKITVVTQGTFGLYPYAFYLEFWGDPNVAILPKWPLSEIDDEIRNAADRGPVYVILKEHEVVPATLPLTPVFRAEKPGGTYPIIVTTLNVEK